MKSHRFLKAQKITSLGVLLFFLICPFSAIVMDHLHDNVWEIQFAQTVKYYTSIWCWVQCSLGCICRLSYSSWFTSLFKMTFVVSSLNLDVLSDCEISCKIELIYRSAYERLATYFNCFYLCIFFYSFFFKVKVLFKIQTFLPLLANH